METIRTKKGRPGVAAGLAVLMLSASLSGAALAEDDSRRVDPTPRPKSAVDAFRTLRGSPAARGRVRRFGDANPMAWNNVLDIVSSAKPGQALKSSFFTTEKDPYGWAYLGGLLYAQLRGVKVTHLNDWSSNARGRGFTSRGGGFGVLQELVRAGAEVGIYNPLGRRVKYLLKHGPSYGVIGCNHDKALVANPDTEEAQGLNGGRNIGQAYYQAATRKMLVKRGTMKVIAGDNDAAWRDDTIHVKGKAACAGLAEAVDRELTAPAMKKVKAGRLHLRNRTREMLAAYALMEEWVARSPLSAAEKTRLRADPGARAAFASKVLAASQDRLKSMIGGLPAQVQQRIPKKLSWLASRNLRKLTKQLSGDLELVGTRAAYQRLGGFTPATVKVIDQTGAPDSAPGQRFNEMTPALSHLLRGAQKRVLIVNPYVVLTENMVQLFEDGAKRGVRYTIYTNSPKSTDSAITQGFFLNSWANVLARVPTMKVWVATGKRKIHAKAFVVDDILTGDTTFNADLLSGLVNGELGTISLSKASAANLRSHIAADLRNRANGFKQWTIEKDASGRAVLDAKGQPIVKRGPKDDLGRGLRALYAPIKLLCKGIAATSYGAPLRLQKAGDLLPTRDW